MKRLIEDLPPGFEASLLQSEAEHPEPSEEARSRALTAAMQTMAAAGAASVVAAEAASAAKASVAGAASTALKASTMAAPFLSKAWVISLVVVAAAVGTTGIVVHQKLSTPSVSSSAPLQGAPSSKSTDAIESDVRPEATAVAPNDMAPPLEPAPVLPRPAATAVKKNSERAPLVAPSGSPAPAASPSAAAAAEDGLAEEIAAIDRARSALAAHHPDETLRILDDHDRRFARGALEREAALLRVEALSARGDRGEAMRLADELLAKNPDGPYRARLRKVLEQSGH